MTDLINRADAIEAVGGVVIDEFDVSPTRGYDVAEKALSALPSTDAEPIVIRAKTLLPTKDFKEWAKRIREVNPNAVVIPCDSEVASADAVPWSVADKIGEDRKRLEERVSELEECLEWIPCSEKLPSDDDWVIVSIDYDRKAHGDNTVYWQNVTIAFYDGTWRSIESIGGESWVTAWMPLPKPYKGGDDK